MIATAAASSLLADETAHLAAEIGRAQLTPEGHPSTEVWSYNGTVPGPILRAVQGQPFRILFENRLQQPSTVHWHGIRLANAMDGVAGLTQDAVQPGEQFLYEFIPPDAGTYWYHPHYRGWEQVPRGLFGALIVEEANPPDVDDDQVLVLNDWRLNGEAEITNDFGNMHDRMHEGRLGNWITVNGVGELNQRVAQYARLRLRLINASSARTFSLGAQGLEGWIVALDGQPLSTVLPFDQIELAPAQRADLIVDVIGDVATEAFLISYEADGGYAIAAFEIQAALRSTALAEPPALPGNPLSPISNLENARQVSLWMQGGAHGGLMQAMLGDHLYDAPGLAEQGYAWALNGRADRPVEPLVDLALGETLKVLMINETSWPHAMHLHGHHFQVLQPDGQIGPYRDTVLLNADQTIEMAVVVDNPGDWLLHCHMLDHAASGMTTWLRIT